MDEQIYLLNNTYSGYIHPFSDGVFTLAGAAFIRKGITRCKIISTKSILGLRYFLKTKQPCQ
jgi:hypothetical protein